MPAEPRPKLASAALVLGTLSLALAAVWALTTPRVRATAWHPVASQPVRTTEPAPRTALSPGLLRQVYRGAGFEHLVWTGSDPVMHVRRTGTFVPSKRIDGGVEAPGLATGGPEAGLPPVGPFTVRWTGILPVAVAGVHGFALTSDDGAVLRIGGTPVVSDWGPHQMNRRETRVWLEPGQHAVEMEHHEVQGDAWLDVEWRPPGGKWERLDGKVFRHVTARTAKPDELPPLPPAPDPDDTTIGATVVYRPMTAMPMDLEPPAIPVWPGAVPFPLERTPDEIVVTRSLLPFGTMALAPETDPRLATFSASWEGFLVVREPGPHRFRMTCDDGARLQVGRSLVIDSWRYQDRTTAEGAVDLQPGLQPFRLSYFNGMGNSWLSLDWKQPGQDWAPVGPDRVSRPRAALPPPSNAAPVWHALLPDLELKRDTDLVGPFVHRWESARDGYPRRRPRPLLRLQAEIVVPEDGFHNFWLRGAGTARLQVGGGAEYLQITGHRGPVGLVVHLTRGQHALTLDYLGPGGGEALGVEWSGPSFERRSLRAQDLARCGRLPVGEAAVVLMALALALALAGAGGLRAALAAHGATAALGLVFVVALCVRLDGYQRVPSPGETDDELTPHISGYWSSRGLAPASWDCVSVWRERHPVEIFGRVFPIVLPFLEYPPLFDAAMGHLSRAGAPRGPFDMPLHLTRLVPIFLSAWCAVLLFRLSVELKLGRGVGLAAAAVHALCPLAVLSGRLVKADGLLAALSLIGLLATVRYRSGGRIAHLLLALATIPLAILTKPTGLALAPAVLLPLLVARRAWASLATIGVTALGLGIWLGWGWYWDGPRFFELVRELAENHHRTHLSAFLPLVTGSRVTGVEWGAAWWTGLLLLGLGGLMSNRRAAPALSLALFYLVTVAATYDAGRNFGWYRLPLYPPLALGVAVFLGDLARRPDPARAFLAAGLLVLPALHVLIPEPWSTSRPLLQAVLLGAAALPSLALLVKKARGPLTAATPVVILAVLLCVYLAADVRLPELYPPLASVPDACPNTFLPD